MSSRHHLSRRCAEPTHKSKPTKTSCPLATSTHESSNLACIQIHEYHGKRVRVRVTRVRPKIQAPLIVLPRSMNLNKAINATVCICLISPANVPQRSLFGPSSAHALLSPLSYTIHTTASAGGLRFQRDLHHFSLGWIPGPPKGRERAHGVTSVGARRGNGRPSS